MTDTHTPAIPHYVLGLDLGEKRDYTALSVLRQRAVPNGQVQQRAVGFDLTRGVQYEAAPVYDAAYDIVHLDRWRGTGYRVIVPKLEPILQDLRQAGHRLQLDQGRFRSQDPNITLLVDYTGVGIAVVEDIRAAGIRCKAVTIHGGGAVTRDGDDYRIPKRELVARVQILLENKRLKIASSLGLAEVLTAELENFKAKKATLTGHDTYGAGADWREGNHDDLVLSVAMAAWYGEQHPPGGDAWAGDLLVSMHGDADY